MGELLTQDADYLRRELGLRGLRKDPEVVIEVCRRLAQGLQSKEKIGEALKLHHATVNKIKGKWEEGELDFLRPYVFETPRLVKEDQDFRKWLADRLETAIGAVQGLKGLVSGFSWYNSDASVPALQLSDPLHQLIIDGIRARSPLLKSLETQWAESTDACLRSARSLCEQFAARLEGCAPAGLERQWAKILVFVSAKGLSGLELNVERADAGRVNLRFGAYGLTPDIGADEAETFQARFAWLLPGADPEAQELREEGARLSGLTGHICEVLDQWLQL